MMPNSVMLVQLTIVIGWSAVLLWGSVMAIRGRRMWATSLLLIGSLCLVISAVGGLVVPTFLIRPGYGLSVIAQVIGPIAVLLAASGLLLITAGFVGLCARFGMVERRAAELEGLVLELHNRMAPESGFAPARAPASPAQTTAPPRTDPQ